MIFLVKNKLALMFANLENLENSFKDDESKFFLEVANLKPQMAQIIYDSKN